MTDKMLHLSMLVMILLTNILATDLFLRLQLLHCYFIGVMAGFYFISYFIS